MKPDDCTGRFNNMSCITAFDLRLISRSLMCEACREKKATKNRSWAAKRLRTKQQQDTHPSFPDREVTP